MKGIYYKDGVYLLIDNNEEHDYCVLNNKKKRKQSLYGGRVYLDWFNIHFEKVILYVDGVSISNISIKYYNENNLTLPLSNVAQNLNAIEVHGVDAFMQNYKQSVEFYYNELKEIRQISENNLSNAQNEKDTEKLLQDLKNTRDMLHYILGVLFSLHTFMSAGLENDKVISVYESIMDTIV